MSREALLRVVADRGNGTWRLPSCVDGLAAPHRPALYFHDATASDLAPWLCRFECGAGVESETSASHVTRYAGHLLGLELDVVNFWSRGG